MRIVHRGSFAGPLIALALVAAACDSTVETTTTAQLAQTTTSTTEAVEGFSYRVAFTVDIPENNFWAHYGPDGSLNTEWVFAQTKPSLFRIAYPGIVVAPDAAIGLPVDAVQEGEVWTVTQEIRDDYTWSDGTLLTADDVVFTFETVRDAALGAAWEEYSYAEGSVPRLLDVEAIDDFTVKYTFDSKPGAAVWPHQVGVAPIMPRAPWEDFVTEALASEDPATVLYESDAIAIGDLSGGPMVYNGREEGVSIENVRNEHYANEGFVHQFWDDGSYALNGELLYGEGTGDPSVEYTEGPYAERMVFWIIGGGQEGYMAALIDGEIDFMFYGLAFAPALRRQGLEADNLDFAVNEVNGFKYLAFNLRKSPTKYLGFRQAMAYFDKENVANNVLQGAVVPLYVLVPEGNTAWYNEEVAAEIALRYVGLDSNERLVAAYAALEADGFTWETPAVFEDGVMVSPGAGIVDPEGNPVPPLTILAPDPGFQPTNAAASLWIEEWAESLGIPAEADIVDVFPSEENPGASLLEYVWPGVDVEPEFDMYMLGWSMGSPAWPIFHEGFFHTRNLSETTDGNNATGYSNPEFDALADAMFTETDFETAYDQVWQMERMIANDLPYVVLFDAPITEFYNKDLKFPFTEVLSGIQFLEGMPGTVSK